MVMQQAGILLTLLGEALSTAYLSAPDQTLWVKVAIHFSARVDSVVQITTLSETMQMGLALAEAAQLAGPTIHQPATKVARVLMALSSSGSMHNVSFILRID
ncbi:hypothetical protein LD112_07880 [Pantoea agglomerans]|nr:hypothetical protein [Pantoea agglomerans]